MRRLTMDCSYLLVACLLASTTSAYVIDPNSPGAAVAGGDAGSSDRVTDPKPVDLYQAAGVTNDHQPNGAGEPGGLPESQDPLDAFRLSPRAAKSILRVRRGWIKEVTGEEDNEEEESREDRERTREATALAAHLARVCPGECWGPYGSLSACSAPCGNSGVKWQHRQVQPSAQCVNWVASNGCPGSSSRSAACNRTCYNGGTAQASSCSCPAGYRGTCCETRVTCGNPGAVSHGSFTPGGTLHFYGVTVTYSCQLGYRRDGASTRVCQNNGQWTNAVPSCNLIDCGDPGTPSNGQQTGDAFTFGQSLSFTCNTGYRLSGDSIRQCQESGQWSGTQTSCAQITCPAPPVPSNGAVSTPDGLAYSQTATYTCEAHYFLSGANTRSCQLDGAWSGGAPVCNAILCDKVQAPAKGSVTFTGATGTSVMHGGRATFACQTGYILTGSGTRTCSGNGPNGIWTGSQPTCQAVNCGDPGTIANGVRSQTGFVFPTGRVDYQCVAGFYMTGNAELRCLSTAAWSANKPSCTACPLNQYKPGSNTATSCQRCLANSHTAAVASNSRQQCECNLGYEGPNGGPCTIITCEGLPLPDNGYMGTCATTYNQVCRFGCNEGYIQTGGNTARTCQLNKQWSGAPLNCTACGKDTYKIDASTCTYCPEDSHTLGEANGLSGCICDDAFQGPNGGPCQDINECETSNGGCAQTCENEIGGFRCTCTLPGSITDGTDPTQCVAKNLCPDLEPIENGGFVCVAEVATTTQRCQPRCNYGYEHFVRPNSYEECGPSTNWVWSSDLRDVPLFPCQKAFFEGVTLEVDMFYFTDDCESLTEGQLASVKVEFLQFLTEDRGLCNSADLPCEVADCTVECGDTAEDEFDFFGRRRRSAEEGNALKVKFTIRVSAVEQESVDCNAVCDREGASERYCTNNCLDNYFANVNDVITMQIGEALSPGDGGDENVIHVGEVTLVPQAAPAVVQLPPSCDEGMVKVGESCAPCLAGSYKSPNATECLVCPPQTFQPYVGQTDCLPCRWMYDWGVARCKDPLEIIIEITQEAFNVVNGDDSDESQSTQ